MGFEKCPHLRQCRGILAGTRTTAFRQPSGEARTRRAHRLARRPRQRETITCQFTCQSDQREPAGHTAHLPSGPGLDVIGKKLLA